MRLITGRLHPAGERGSSTIDAVLILPIVALTTLVAVTLAMASLATNVAEAAARQGLHAASAYEGGDAEGREEARAYLNAVMPILLARAQVEVTRTATTVTVRVHGPVLSILPWPRSTVDARVSGPIERFVAR